MKVNTKPDTLDLEHLNELGVNFGYRLVAERLRATLDQARADLEHAETWERMRLLQGQIASLRLALGMPDQLAKEFRSRMKGAA